MVTTTNDFLMHDAIMYNIKAVPRMQAGDYEGAFNLLCTCITNLSSARQASMKHASPDYTSAPSTGIIVTSSWIEATNDCFYSGPLLFSLPGNDIFILLSLCQIKYCTTICLFNMALACPLECKTCQDARKRDLHLSQAPTLYSTAYEILQKYKIKMTDAVVVVVMADGATLIDIETECGNLDHGWFWRKSLWLRATLPIPATFEAVLCMQFSILHTFCLGSWSQQRWHRPTTLIFMFEYTTR